MLFKSLSGKCQFLVVFVLLLIFFIFIIFLLLDLTIDQVPISLKSRDLKPQSKSEALDSLIEVSAQTNLYHIIQFDRILNKTESKKVESSGIKLIQYLHNKAWIVKLRIALEEDFAGSEYIVGSWSLIAQDKLSPMLVQDDFPPHSITENDRLRLSALLFPGSNITDVKELIVQEGGVIENESIEFLTLFFTIPKESLTKVAGINEIHWIQAVPSDIALNMGRARIFLQNNEVQEAPYELSGQNIRVSIHEKAHSFHHKDYYNRWSKGDSDPLFIDGFLGEHAAMTAGTIAGDASFGGADLTYGSYKGMAPSANITTYSFGSGSYVSSESNRLDDIVDAVKKGHHIANNSWGYLCTELPYGDYTAQSRLYDLIVLGRSEDGKWLGPPITVVFSAGNERENTQCSTSYYNKMNQPKTAKNIIAVGAVDSDADYLPGARIANFSSFGPTDDHRIKPEIVAAGLHGGATYPGTQDVSVYNNPFGTPPPPQAYRATLNKDVSDTQYGGYGFYSQTSAAASMVSGNAAIFMEDFLMQTGCFPLPSTVKAHFVHSAVDLHDGEFYSMGPDNASGYGLLQIRRAIDLLRLGNNFREGWIDQGETDIYLLNVYEGGGELKVTLVWDDPPASPASGGPALINDIDLIVTDHDGIRYYPWTLSNYTSPATQDAEDHINNIEQVKEHCNQSGLWTISIKGNSIPEGPQKYSLVMSLDNYNSSNPNLSNSQEFIDVSTAVTGYEGKTNAVAWGDLDNDNDMDLYLANYNENTRIRNDGVFGFTDITMSSGSTWDSNPDKNSNQAAWIDFDNDGKLDIYVVDSTSNSDNYLLKNLDGNVFYGQSYQAITGSGNKKGMSWADYDLDVDLDLFLCDFDGDNRLFRNTGSGFEDITPADIFYKYRTMSAIWGDYDNDGDPDLYLVRDGFTNILIRNQGDGSFLDATTDVVGDAGFGLAASWGDFNNDGRLDLYLSNHSGPNKLFKNLGNGNFEDVTEQTLLLGMNITALCYCVNWVDFDLDGYLDLYVSDYYGPNRLFKNINGVEFDDVTVHPLSIGPGSMGCAWADYDNDGDPDLYVGTYDGKNRLIRNNASNNNNWIQIKLIGNNSNKFAVGAKIQLRSGSITQTREISSQHCIHSQNSTIEIFGLGLLPIDDIIVKWPGGTQQLVSVSQYNHLIEVYEE